MNELEVILSMDAMRAILEGQQIVFDCEPEGLRVILVCDANAMRTFKEHVTRALLVHLPGPTSIN
jgi:hypothetical protein